MKKLFSQRFNVVFTLLGFSYMHSVTGVQADQKDNPPIVLFQEYNPTIEQSLIQIEYQIKNTLYTL